MVDRFYGGMSLLLAQIQDPWQIGKIHTNGDVENLSVGQSFLSRPKVAYHHLSPKDQARLHEISQDVLPSIFMGYALHVDGSWKGDFLVDAPEVYV